MIRTSHYRAIDWEIDCLTRMEVRLGSAAFSRNENLYSPPTVEEMLGMPPAENELHLRRKKALVQVSDQLYRIKAGRAGEDAVDRSLSEILMPPGTYVLRNARITIRNGYQIEVDTLILSPSFMLILEIKNVPGSLFFKESEGKTTRVRNNGEIDEFDCFIHQLDRQTEGLQQFLQERHISLPVHGVVVLSNQNTVIKQRPDTYRVIYRKQLARYVRALPPANSPLHQETVDWLASAIRHSAPHPAGEAFCDKLGIDAALLRKGVLCLACNQAIGRFPRIGWYCKSCDLPGKEAVRQAVDDRLTLIKPTINNPEARDFLGMKHSSDVSRILNDLDLIRTGNPPATLYRKKESRPLRWKG
ncbi:nuclease-related domain-containing protein [Bhargavaea ullalensis]|uniref:NERD domain-containing protein n=1 Tax=Bhargavaea ullalensis TaxID=1265685 RepID=A0ABV2GBH9_9BACL